MTLSDFRTCLVFGGARSGKTRRALSLAEACHETLGLRPVYLATAQAFDDEMTARIDAHKAERGPEWSTVECPLDLPAAIAETATPETVLLVDCLTLWLTNVTFAERDLGAETDGLIQSLGDAPGRIVVVSNEVGHGIVPENALARRFRDDQGRLNQTVAAAVDRVEFVAAGLPLALKG